uniref:Putative secreted protein n=1 Tax=Ixodes ricinus TaxID=34613 RepID=A0A6B0UB49_IXORI
MSSTVISPLVLVLLHVKLARPISLVYYLSRTVDAFGFGLFQASLPFIYLHHGKELGLRLYGYASLRGFFVSTWLWSKRQHKEASMNVRGI